MLLVKYIRENLELTKKKLKNKKFQNIELISQILELDDTRRITQYELDAILRKIKFISKQIGMLLKEGKKEEVNSIKTTIFRLKEISDKLKNNLFQNKKKLFELLSQVPNLPHESVPKGKNSSDNEIVLEKKNKVFFSFNSMTHWELSKKYKLIDFDLGAKVTGSGFPVYIGKGARLQRALIHFFLDFNSKKGYREILPPFLVNELSAFGTGQLPDKEEQMYYIQNDNLYLIPTSEIPVTNLYRDVLLLEKDLPILNTSYSPCFRREAGSYGKEVRGLNRLHQFEKVEIVRIEKPENSYEALEEMVLLVKELIEKLELSYRILKLCEGNMSFSSALTYDFEVWSPIQKKWLEVSSVSNFETFQSNRLNLRYKSKEKIQLCHTLNASALALPRVYAALLENNQSEKGIQIPKALQSYTGFELIN